VTGRGTPIANLVVNDLVGVVPHFAVSASTTEIAGSPFNITLTAENADNTTNTAYVGTVTFTSSDPLFSISDPNVTQVGNTWTYTFAAGDLGSRTFSGVLLKTAGNQTISAADSANQLAGNAGVLVTPGAPDHLVFGQQPSSAAVGGAISPAVTVVVVDAWNNPETGFTPGTGKVTIARGAGSSAGTLGGTLTASVVNGVATFNNLSISAAGTYTFAATTNGLAPVADGTSATSAQFKVVAATTIESFDGTSPLNAYTRVGGFSRTATVAAAAKHDGGMGLSDTNGSDWNYRNPATPLVKAGDSISVWLQFATSASGTASFGFGASSSGTLALVASPGTNQLILQRVTFGFFGATTTQLAAVTQTFVANHWYRLRVDWSTSGAIIGKLYDSNGTTLLNTVTYSTPTTIKSGGIAFQATGSGTKYWDTVTDTPNVNSFAAKSAAGSGSGNRADAIGAALTSYDLAGWAMVNGLWNGSDNNRRHS
jgi:hypothetical protein